MVVHLIVSYWDGSISHEFIGMVVYLMSYWNGSISHRELLGW